MACSALLGFCRCKRRSPVSSSRVGGRSMERDATPTHRSHPARHGFICIACGTQFAPSEVAPPSCPICEDDRQFVPPDGQRWTIREALGKSHVNAYREYEPGLIGIGTYPRFAIGQRAL